MSIYRDFFAIFWTGSLALMLASFSSPAEAQEITVIQPDFPSNLTEIRIVSRDQPSEILISRTGGWRDRKLEIEIVELWTHETLRKVIPVHGNVILDITLSQFDDTLTNDSEYGATIFSGTGNDLIECGWRNDTVYLGSGNDVADLGSGDDVAYGGPGRDVIFGGNGDDYIRGNSGGDLLVGERGDDEMHGGDGADLLYGDDGDDYLAGGASADGIRGAQGFNTLIVDPSDVLVDWPPFMNVFVHLGGNIIYSGEYAFKYVAVYSDNP
ncbi:hypothetical protein OAG68_01785 [bacterium]|nr:hypothetical protein [bacterium]